MPEPTAITALHEHARANPAARTLLVAPLVGTGRQLLRTLAVEYGGWSGIDVTTPRPLARRIAQPGLSRDRVRVVDEFEEEALADSALDEVLEDPEIASPFAEVLATGGFRRGVRNAVQALRLAGIPAGRLRRTRFESAARGTLLAAVLAAYEAALARERATDVAGVLARATAALAEGSPLPTPHVFLLPGMSTRGNAGRFLDALQAAGAVVLPAPRLTHRAPPGILWPEPGEVAPPADPGLADLPLFDAAAVDAPEGDAGHGGPETLEVFRAAGVHEECREVLRRIVASGVRFEEVEIVTPDPMRYGPPLHALAGRLDIDVTYAGGLPVERTRPGRALAAWFRWIEGGFASVEVRRMLMAGEIGARRTPAIDASRLARALRGLRIGWGRDRYLPILDAALRRATADEPEPRRWETPEDARGRQAREAAEYRALRSLLVTLLRFAPEPGSTVSPATLARGVLAILELCEVDSEVDHSARERLARVADRVRAVLTRPTSTASAISALREHLAIRIPAPRVEGRAPWLADGGALHVSDLEHAGGSGRPVAFVVGLDADAFPGSPTTDPMLLDVERRRLGDDLPTRDDVQVETRFRWSRWLAAAPPRVTLSWTAWEAAEARRRSPSPMVLAAVRSNRGDPGLGYEDLSELAGPPVSRVPHGEARIDGDDVWLHHLVAARGASDGEAALRASLPALDRGLAGRAARAAEVASAWVGFVGPDHVADPTGEDARALSASALESLGTCPLRFFYQRVLRLHPPDDPEFDPERWLPPDRRGTLLHTVFEHTVDHARLEQLGFDDDAVTEAAYAALERECDRMRHEFPPPSDHVFRAEVAAARADVGAFLALLQDQRLSPDDVFATEHDFGDDGACTISLPDGSRLPVRGRIDRIDRLEGGLRVVDYKTGSNSPRRWDPEVVFNGGRRLQHLVYARAATGLGTPVVESAYHFPTLRGENTVVSANAFDLGPGDDLLLDLVEMVRRGAFPATDTPDDCTYCDFRSICRAPERGTAERVEWTAARMKAGDDSVDRLQSVRGIDE